MISEDSELRFRLIDLDGEANTEVNKESYYQIKYFIGCINLYFVCELLKTSSLVTLETYHYSNCIKIFEKNLPLDITEQVCDMLNYQENFTKFVTNLLFMLMLVNTIVGRHLKECISLKYWIVAHISAITFTLLGNVDAFQFSINSNSQYDATKISILSLTGGIVSTLICYQAYYRRIPYRLLLIIISLHLFILTLLCSVSEKVKYHFHHALCTSVISICFIDFESLISTYSHSILMGITIQGINFYTIEDTFLFKIPYIDSPSLVYMLWLTPIFAISWLSSYVNWSRLIRFLGSKCKRKKTRDVAEYEIPLLVPDL